MAISIKPTSCPAKRLAESITASSSSFKVSDIVGWDDANLTSADFGTVAYASFRNSTGTELELMEIDPSTITAATSPITINKRGLKFTGDRTTEVAGNKKTWVKGDTIVQFGTDVPQLFQTLAEYIDSVAIAGSPDASLTAKGLVETATTAEIDAGTTNGATGANLSTRPDQLAASIYATRLPSADQKAALVGESGTSPSATNKFLDSAALIGDIVEYGTSTAPSGWLACSGAAVSRATYAGLFAVIGTTWGSGDGSTTFNLPLVQNRARMPKLDATSYGTTNSAAGLTVAHTCGTLASLLVVGVYTNSATATVTYNSVSMTSIDSQAVAGGGTLQLFYLISPTTGNNNIVVSGESAKAYQVLANSYSGTVLTSVLGETAKATATAATASVTITPTVANDIVVSLIGTASVTITAYPGYEIYQTPGTSWSQWPFYMTLFDKETAANQLKVFTYTLSGSGAYGHVTAVFKNLTGSNTALTSIIKY